ncbi:hypothetical protein BH24CHL6_BH24CHL6_14070 [soil metagenome]
MVSLVEGGHFDRVSLRVVRRILGALDASVVLVVHWRAGALDRVLDEDHAVLVGRLAGILRAAGWLVETEVTYSHFGERGSYDILAYHPATGIVLVVEAKTDLPSVEQTARKLDEKVRLAPMVARERFGWQVRAVARLLAMPDERGLRRRVGRHAGLLDVAFPARTVATRRWVKAPSGVMSGLWFLTSTNPRGAIQRQGGRQRVRTARKLAPSDEVAA